MATAFPVLWTKNLLNNPDTFKQCCSQKFRAFDADRSGTLDWSETGEFAADLCSYLGLPPPAEHKLRTAFEACDKNHDEVLSEAEFLFFFKAFLRSSLPTLEKIEKAPFREEQKREAATKRAKLDEVQRQIAAHTGQYHVVVASGTRWSSRGMGYFGVVDFTDRFLFMCDENQEALAKVHALNREAGPTGASQGLDVSGPGPWRTGTVAYVVPPTTRVRMVQSQSVALEIVAFRNGSVSGGSASAQEHVRQHVAKKFAESLS